MKRVIAIVLIASVAFSPLTMFGAAKKEKLKPYPLKTCLVSDEKLGEMGDAYVFDYKGQEIKLCCKGCLKDFKKDPAKYLKKLEKTGDKAPKKPATN